MHTEDLTYELKELERIIERQRARNAGANANAAIPMPAPAADDPRSQVLADAMRPRPYDITGRR